MDIRIVSKEKKKTADGAEYYEIVLSDGSEWVCDWKGEHWKPVALGKTLPRNPKKPGELSDDYLTAKFLAGKTPISLTKKK